MHTYVMLQAVEISVFVLIVQLNVDSLFCSFDESRGRGQELRSQVIRIELHGSSVIHRASGPLGIEFTH